MKVEWNAILKASCLLLDISCICERLVDIAIDISYGGEAVREGTDVGAYRMCESLIADVEAPKF